MIAKSQIKFIRIAPPKVRQVIDIIRGKDVSVALSILETVNKRASATLLKLLGSAIANAKVKGFNEDQLFISKIVCNVGPSWKRFKAAAFGRAQPILRRTSHIKIELDVKNS
jgi:large subunit ribosomal protein L22